MFDDARKARENAPTFHEIRSLGSKLYADAGAELTDIMDLMAHSEQDMRLYQTGHELPWQRVSLRLTNIGGTW